jgi:hypothetical protein
LSELCPAYIPWVQIRFPPELEPAFRGNSTSRPFLYRSDRCAETLPNSSDGLNWTDETKYGETKYGEAAAVHRHNMCSNRGPYGRRYSRGL